MKLLFKNKNFRLLWISQVISNIGDWLNAIAIPLLVLRLTNSPIAVSFYMVSRFIPNILFSSVTGILVDKFNRKKIMIFSDLGRFCIFLLYPYTTNVYQVYGLAFLATIFTLLFEPAKSATIPNIVEEDKLLEANSISSSTASLMRLLGTAVGGILITTLDLKVTFYINSITFIISALTVFFIRVSDNKMSSSTEKERDSISGQLKQGFSAILSDKLLSTLIFMDALSIVGYGFLNVLLPIFAIKVLTNSESAYGFIMSFFSSGLFIGSLLMNKISQKKSLPILWCIGLTLSGITQIFFGLSYSIIIAAVFIFMTGFGDAIQIVSYSTIRHKIVPDNLRGRVFSIAEGINSGALLIGMGSTGFLLNIINARILTIFSGTLILISGFISFVAFRRVFNNASAGSEVST
ncbi:MFS transporter [Caloranaerobacter sp. DY30410]|uniref:MFS transporter n=1 Tax=Caloranaerobacter sp. DY30410 TaxID=3238305 RepID=UPI003CFC76AF